MKQLFLSIICFLAATLAFGQNFDTYSPKDGNQTHPCIIYIYGGGFSDNNQREEKVVEFCKTMADHGFVTLAIDYRLGMKDVKAKGVLSMIKPVRNSIKIATEDLFSSVDYVLNHSEELKVDTSKIILVGSSAGAITALQSDYALCNRQDVTAAIPDDFRFAGIISFSGGIYSREGKCDYRVHAPAPTLFFHGTSDRLVPYKKIVFFRQGMFGSNEIVKRFEKFGYPYCIYRCEGLGHEVAGSFNSHVDVVLWFIDNMVFNGKKLQIDLLYDDMDYNREKISSMKPQELYK